MANPHRSRHHHTRFRKSRVLAYVGIDASVVFAVALMFVLPQWLRVVFPFGGGAYLPKPLVVFFPSAVSFICSFTSLFIHNNRKLKYGFIYAAYIALFVLAITLISNLLSNLYTYITHF